MASGPLATTIIDAVRDLDEPWHIIGVDSNPFHIHAANIDERILVPRIKDPAFMPLMRQIIAETKPDFFWPLHDDEIPMFLQEKDLGVRMFLPELAAFELTQDKMKSIEYYKENGIPVPETVFINNREDLEEAFKLLNGEIWLRAVRGAGGKGAYRTSSMADAISWLDLNKGWGSFTAAEVVDGADCMVETIWNKGELIYAASRTRPNGVKGEISRGSRSRRMALSGAPESVREVGIKAIKAVSKEPHGIFFVDTKIDANGVPRVTEINAGRFPMTGSPTYRRFGVNPVGAVLKLAFGEPLDFDTPAIEPIPANIIKLNGVEFPTMFMNLSETQGLQEQLEDRLKALKNPEPVAGD